MPATVRTPLNARLLSGMPTLAVLLGLVGAGVSWIGSAIPSFWFDEIATLMAARLDGPGLWQFLQHKDAVHGLYYALIHVWIQVCGDSSVALRGFSALAVGLGTAGMVVLGTRLAGARFGVIAAVIYLVLPRTTFMGIEGRSYALGAALVVWGVIALIAAARRNTWWSWMIYTVLSIITIYLFMYAGLILAAHLAYLLFAQRDRRTLLRWGISTLIILVAVIPLVRAGYGQRGQIAWLSGQPIVNAWTTLVEPWLDGSWLLAILVIVLLIIAGRRLPQILARFGTPPVALAAAWAFAPLILMLIANSLFGPLYTSRYMSFTTPGFALLLALAVSVFSRRWIVWALVGVIALASLPTYVAQRGPNAKQNGVDFLQTAQTIAEHASPGDAFFLQNDKTTTIRPRLTVNGYPSAFARLDDLAFVRSDLENGNFNDVTLPPRKLGERLHGVRTVWVAGSTHTTPEIAAMKRELARHGFVEQERYPLRRTVVTEYVREETR
ncbi:glycosyltransferase family 39 protein [Mycetocola sp. BIGb0189]|uniref:glycosyltransferase family 39 protein n=1 Tax=Mycetocola sp. BIGb0189 TaxID=2940604 RepID=UPI002168B95F|nr:glycosyltransferase family 39 protein [Mycetocola sp. BIGb0189]